MGIRTERPRGAPLGNTNRLKHGDYSAQRIQRRKEVNVLLRNARNLIRRIEMMTWSRRALRRKMEEANSTPTAFPGETRARARVKGRGPRIASIPNLRVLGSPPSRHALGARRSPGMTTRGIRGSPIPPGLRLTQRHAVAMTNLAGTAMPFAGKSVMAFP